MGRGKSVLVVDDDPAVRDIVATALEVDGYRVDCAANGREALDRADERAPHAGVFDVTTPVRDGWEFLARWQALPAEQRAPVLVVSALGTSNAALRRGAQGVLSKPFDSETLETVPDLVL